MPQEIEEKKKLMGKDIHHLHFINRVFRETFKYPEKEKKTFKQNIKPYLVK